MVLNSKLTPHGSEISRQVYGMQPAQEVDLLTLPKEITKWARLETLTLSS